MRRALLLVLCACGRVGFEPAGACAAYTPFGAPVHLDAVASAEDDWDLALSPDGATAVYSRAGATPHDLYAAFGAELAFDPPQRLGGLDTDGVDENATWSPDGTTLYFSSDGRGAGMRLYTSAFDGATFGPPALVSDLATVEVFGAFVSQDNLELVYTTGVGNGRLAHALRSAPGTPWQPAGDLTELNTNSLEGFPTLSADRLDIYFDGWRSGHRQIFHARRPTPLSPFGPATVVTELDDGSSSGDPELSRDGLTMVFTSNRTGSAGYDLWYATRTCL